MNRRVWILLAAILVAVFVVYLFPAIPQSEAYHNFADTRAFLGVPNFLNVASNALFLLVGLPGMWFASQAARRSEGRGLNPAVNATTQGGLQHLKPGSPLAREVTLNMPANAFLDGRERWLYLAFFVGVTLTAFGSAWYHLRPNDHTLVWDRIPMAIGFMSLVAALVAERIDVAAGLRLLVPLIAVGIGRVLYWDITQSHGHGDLRPYALAQFGSLLVLLLLVTLFPPRYTRTPDLAVALGLYGVAKIFEAADRIVFSAVRAVSGHTVKHVFAALSAYWILRMLRLRTPISPE